MLHIKRFIIAGATLLISLAAHASSPQLNKILPRGAQRGSEIDVDFLGLRLKDAQEVILYDKGITVTKLEAIKPEQVKVHLMVAADAPLGEYRMRLRCESGISELRTFWVGPFPTIGPTTKPLNIAFDNPQQLPTSNITVAGAILSEQVHYYRIDAKKGERISAEVEGMRLGTTMFDPYLAISDTKHFEIATVDDTALLKQDPFICMLAPTDGPFIIAVRESAFGGSPDAQYRLHVGNFPRPKVIFPLGGQTGQAMKITFLGDPRGPISQQITLPPEPVEEMPLYAVQENQSPPSPNYFRVSPFPNVMEVEPNHDVKSATEAAMEPPLAFNGIVAAAGEEDFFKFKAQKGQSLEITVWARRLRSPLDSFITVFDAKGQYLANNDDAGGPDSALRFTPPADGDYIVSIRDHLRRGGPEFAYRIELTLPRTVVTLSIPNATQVNGPSQERQTIPIPRGNRYATLMRAVRAGANGELALSSGVLPEGVTMSAEPFVGGTDVTPVVFEASPEAPIAGKLCDFAVKGKEEFKSDLTQQVDLIQQNNTSYSHTLVHNLAVAVTKEAPFKLNLVQPKAPLVQGGTLRLKVQAERSGDFKGAINVRMLFDPPGVSAQPVDIAADKTEIAFPLSASEGAALRKWRICVIGSSNVDGQLWVSSQLVDLNVVQPFIGGKIQMTAAEQGSTAQVVCDLKQLNPFEGKAKVELLGLPGNSTAEPREITAADAKVVFDVVTTSKTPASNNAQLFVQATMKKDGEEIVQSFAKGGVLRIDRPRAGAVKPASEADAKK